MEKSLLRQLAWCSSFSGEVRATFICLFWFSFHNKFIPESRSNIQRCRIACQKMLMAAQESNSETDCLFFQCLQVPAFWGCLTTILLVLVWTTGQPLGTASARTSVMSKYCPQAVNCPVCSPSSLFYLISLNR